MREIVEVPRIRESSYDDWFRLGRDPVRYRAYQKAYRQRPGYNERNRARHLAYSRRPEVIARAEARRKTPEAIARVREYSKRRKQVQRAASIYFAELGEVYPMSAFSGIKGVPYVVSGARSTK